MSRSKSAALVARGDELALLEERLDGAQSGTGGVVLLGGEPGIGKSRLISEVASRARARRMTVAWGRCREDGGTPAYWPWVQALRAVVAGTATDRSNTREPIAQDVADLIAPVPEAGRADSDAHSRFRLFESVSTLLRSSAGDRGALVIFDDLHRADEDSLLLLRYVAADLTDSRVLVLGAYRNTEVTDDHPLAAAIAEVVDGASGWAMPLHGLSVGDVERLVAAHCAAEVAAEVGEIVAARTDGNPFYVIEVARLLRRRGDRAATIAANAVPPTIRGVIHQRVADLPKATRRVLDAAAVLGRDFGRLPLAEMLGASELAIVASLQPVANAQLIVADPEGGYRFTHALVQEALYEELAPEARTALHRSAAQSLAAHAAGTDDQLNDLAYHSYHAALGDDPMPALEHTRAAGRRSKRRFAYEDAAQWFSLALELSERADLPEAELLDLLLEAADVDWRAGRNDRARERFERVAERARHLHDGVRLARAALGVGASVVTAAGVDWPLVALLEVAADAADDDATAARLKSRLAIELYWHESGSPARQRSAEALALAESSGDGLAVGVALHARQFTLRGSGHLKARTSIGERLVELAEARRDLDLTFQGITWLAADLLCAADITGFRSRVRALHNVAERSGQPLHRWYATVYDAELATIEGRVDDAVAIAMAAAALGRRLGMPMASVFDVSQRAVIARDRTGIASLSAELDDIVARFPYFVTVTAIGILADADAGRTAEAGAAIDRLSPDGFAAIPSDSLWLATVALLAEAAAGIGSVHLAQLAELLRPRRGEIVVQGLPSCWGSVDRFLGRAELAMGNYAEAEEALVSADAIDRAIGAPMFLARTTLDRARLAAAQGHDTDAMTLAAQTVSMAERMGLDALAGAARRLVAVTPSPLDPAAQAGLSRREREVLTLLSNGATNKEIASALVLSLNTVERHLANIYTKLGVRGRAEASAFAVRAGLS